MTVPLQVPRMRCAEDWDWQLQAACRGLDLALFYPPDQERPPARIRRERRAKLVCHRCHVAADCLEWALLAPEPDGVWGGLNVKERCDVLAAAHSTATTATVRAG